MKDKLLKEISESGSFTENNIFQFCVDNDYDIGTVTSTINELIDSGELIKSFLSPDDSLFYSEDITINCMSCFHVKYKKLNILKLMDGI